LADLRREGGFGGRPRARRSPFVSRSRFVTSDANEGATRPNKAMTEKSARMNGFIFTRDSFLISPKGRYELCLNEEGQWVTKDSGVFAWLQKNERNDATLRANEIEEEKGGEKRTVLIFLDDWFRSF
jgi:hypothetical protein